ncbi:MAG: ATP-dependent helicase [Thermodesulfobacteriaceae bacterium]|nr:ATP-dependent helicase [Thermodesulfobacteriaceae bacterium]MDW8135549.1 ATP-dependent helicase [Thermodesulfobacterium sp.]
MFEKYTEEQKKIILEKEDLLVIAGPGTGKTYTLIGKIKHLLEKEKVFPEKISILTYAVKTSQELKEKLKGEHLDFIKVDTFHGLAYDLWRDYYGKSPSIISEEERKKICEKLFPKQKNPLKNFQNKVFYFEYLKKRGILDFDLLFYEIKKIPKKFEKGFIIIDEFQDLSPDILNFLSKFKEATFTFLGDPYQSIYSFKGVNLEYLKNFLNLFKPKLKELTLSLSFRCPEVLLEYAKKFKVSPWKEVNFKGLSKGGIVEGYFLENIWEEAKFLSKLIRELIGGLSLEEAKQTSTSPSQIFVLSRIKEVFKVLKENLIKEGFPVSFPEDEAKEYLNQIQKILENNNFKKFPQIFIKRNPSIEMESFIKNIWYLSGEEEEKFWFYLKKLETLDLIFPKREGINFLSIHGSKGLEADYVFLVGAEEDLIPLKIFKDTLEDEEKRLVYVALTRAKKGFYFTALKEREILNFSFKKGLSSYFKDFPFKIITSQPKKPKQIKLF